MVCAISVIWSLVYAITLQLDSITIYSVAMDSNILINGLIYFLLPILITAAISNDHPSSRILIAIFCWLTALKLFLSKQAHEQPLLIWVTILLLTAGAIWWLFIRTKSRVYYAVLSDKTLPVSLESKIEEILQPSKLEQLLLKDKGKLGSHMEIWIVVIMLLFFLVLFVFDTSPTVLFLRLQ